MSIRKGTTIISGNPASPSWGSIEGVLDDQLDLKNSLGSKAPLNSPVLTGTPQAPTASAGTNNKQIATTQFVQTAVASASSLPSQSGQSGKFLTTNGTTASWGSITGLPSQSGNNGKILTTNGTTASWISYNPTPDTDNNTVSLNSSNKLQAIGLIDKKSGNAIYDWIGTYSQWQSGRNGGTIPDNWICYITDDYDSLSDDIVSIEQDITAINNTLSNKLDSRYISNCVLEVPQDVNIEVTYDFPNPGSLSPIRIIAKAGSKVYIPDGFEQDGTTRKFITREITEDKDHPAGDGLNQVFVFTPGSGVTHFDQHFGGDTAPTVSGTALWYDTATNYIKSTMDSGTTWNVSGYSLPMAVFDKTNDVYTNVTTFNGVGYIGNTLFRISKISGLIPNGRNTDGTSQNIGFSTNSSVAIRTFINPPDGINYISLTSNSFAFNQYYRYDQTKNIQYGNDNIPFSTALHFAEINVKNNKIISLNNKNVFQALDYNNETMLGLGMPDYSSPVQLSWNLNYTASENGWLIAWADASNSGTFSVEVFVDGCQVAQARNAASYSYGFSIMVPVRKNSIITSTGNPRENKAYFVPCLGD